MKLFLRNILLFLSIPILLFVFTIFFLNYKGNKKLNEYKIDKKTTIAFFGDSHVQECVNDSLVPNSINLALHSESLYFTYYKMKGILNNNQSIKKIYLGLSYHSLSNYYDDFVFGIYSKSTAPKYFFILPNSEKINILKHNSDNLSVFVKSAIKHSLDFSYMGSYENNFKNSSPNINSIEKRLNFQFYKDNKLNEFSELNLSYLKKIIELCDEKKVELIFLNTPLHSYYKERVPKEYIKKYNEIIAQYNLQLINFEDLILNDSCFIPDGDHVSEKGAIIASKYLAK